MWIKKIKFQSDNKACLSIWTEDEKRFLGTWTILDERFINWLKKYTPNTIKFDKVVRRTQFPTRIPITKLSNRKTVDMPNLRR